MKITQINSTNRNRSLMQAQYPNKDYLFCKNGSSEIRTSNVTSTHPKSKPFLSFGSGMVRISGSGFWIPTVLVYCRTLGEPGEPKYTCDYGRPPWRTETEEEGEGGNLLSRHLKMICYLSICCSTDDQSVFGKWHKLKWKRNEI